MTGILIMIGSLTCVKEEGFYGKKKKDMILDKFKFPNIFLIFQ